MTLDQAMAAARQHHAAGRLREAEGIYRQVLAASPGHAEATHLLGLVALQCGQAGAAVGLMERSVGLGTPEFWWFNNLAEAYKQAGRFADAAGAFERSLGLRPGDPETMHSRAIALEHAGEVDRAIEALREVVARFPELAKGAMSLGAILEQRGVYDEALGLFERAVAVQPDYAKARAARAAAWLRAGDYERGWEEYEWRWRVAGFPGRPPAEGVPVWGGEELGGRTILLYAEQGLGDSIQFVRYAPLVAARGGRVVVEVPATLVRLVRTVEGVSDVVPAGEASPEYDVQLPMMSLPRVMGTRLETVPARVPYVSAPAEGVERWRGRVTGEGLKVGLCWAGGRSQPGRSVPMAEMARLVEGAQAGVRFFSLQKDRLAGEESGPVGVLDWMPEAGDFADTAGIVAGLDLVVTVDTAVAHLAGAMGKQTWVMLPRHADWRWGVGREDSPWYPTVRLFRQERAGEWGEVVARVGAALRERAG